MTMLTDKPVRIQLRRTKGWRMPENTVKVDRTTRFGNPAIVRKDKMVGTGCEDDEGNEILQGPWACFIQARRLAGWWFPTKREAANKAVEYFRYLATSSPGKDGWQAKARDLRGKNLACWCPLDHPCHADVLLELANKDAPHAD